MQRFKYLIPLLIIGLLVTANSCTQDLTEQTYSSITQQNNKFTKKDYPKAIGPVYSNIRGLVAGWFGLFDTQEVGTDEMAQPANASGWSDGGIYLKMEKHTWTPLTPQISTLWNTLYKGVIHSNRIIGNLKDGKIKVPDGTSKDAAIAEMRTARAFYYWLIMDNFGDAPLVTDPKSKSTELPSKTSREKIYQFVVKELKESIPKLSESAGQEMYGRFNKWSAKTLLATVYLNAEVYTGTTHWDKVISETNDIINSGKYQLAQSFEDPFKVHNENSNEIIFSIPFDENNATGFDIEQNVSFHVALKKKFQLTTTPYGAGSAKMVPQFGAVYDSLNDKRYYQTWLMGYQFAPNGDTLRGAYDDAGEALYFSRKFKDGVYTSEDAGFRIQKWEIEKGALGSLNNDFPFFRYSRVLMMKAEALLRTGEASQAASIVSQVRMRDFNNPTNATVTAADLTKDSAIDYGYWQNFQVADQGNTEAVKYGGFLDELGREFACEMFRRRDMIRFGIYTKKSYLAHRPQGDYRSVFPIPQDVVQSNPNLKQNPDY